MQRSSSTPDYQRIIDEETHEFIRLTEQAYPPDTTSSSIEQQRKLYDNMTLHFRQARPDGIVSTDRPVNRSIDYNDAHCCLVRTYENVAAAGASRANPAGKPPTETSFASSTIEPAQVLYFHGGGFVVGSLSSHDDVCAEICHYTGLNVTSVDYRLLPEHPHPAAFNDGLSAVYDNHARFEKSLLLCGDSAGANLCAALAHHLRQTEIQVAGQVLIYPGLGADMNSGSYIEHAHAPMLSTEEVRYYTQLRLGSPNQKPCAQIAPLCDTDFSRLPPTFIVSAECDPLNDDGRLYCNAITDAGGQAIWINEAGLVHGYLRARHTVARAKNSFERILRAIDGMANHRSLHELPIRNDDLC